MSKEIVIYGVPDDADNKRAIEQVKILSGVTARFIMCPPSVRELYRVPFLIDKDSGRHFGMESIKKFVDELLQEASVDTMNQS